MKKLIIIGAGGMGRTAHDIAIESKGYGNDFIVWGFIDDDVSALDKYEGYPPILGKISDYVPKSDEIFISSIGGDSRKRCIEALLKRGAIFTNLIHTTSRIGSNVRIGQGNIIAAFATLGADSKIGDFNLIQSSAVIGHDAIIGNYNRIDCHATCVGGIEIGDEVTVHTSAVINHGVKIANRAKVGACSFVIKNVKEGMTVFGIPARTLSL